MHDAIMENIKLEQWWENLSARELKCLLHSIKSQQQELQTRVNAMQGEIEQLITNGADISAADLKRIESYSQTLYTTQNKFNRLEKKYAQIYDSWQKIHIEERIAEDFGPNFETWLNAIVFVAILAVIYLLFYDLVYMDDAKRSWSFPSGNMWQIFYVDLTACAVFLFDLVWVRWRRAEDKKWFLRKNWLHLLSSIPVPPVSELQWLRLIRLLRLLRGIRILMLVWRGIEHLERVTDRKLMTRTIWLIGLIIALGTLFMPMVEPTENSASAARFTAANQQLTYSDAACVNDTSHPLYYAEPQNSLWWTFTTVSTGGYADLQDPKSSAGRIITALLIISGWVLFGVFTATLTDVYRGPDSDDTLHRLERIESRLELMSAVDKHKG